MKRNRWPESPALISFALIVLGLISATFYLSTLFLGNLEENFVSFEIVFFVLFGLYLLVIYLVFKQKIVAREVFLITIFFALIFRFVLLFSEPSLSIDIFRYLWDGRVQLAGVNPYRYPPAAAALAPLRDSIIYQKIYRPNLPTIYPPLSETFFFLAQLVGRSSPLVFKSIIILIDTISIALLAMLLKIQDTNPAKVVIYAWSPLVIFEFGHSGHIDALLIPFVILAVWSRIKDRDGLSGFFLGLATLVKIYPALLFFALVRRGDWKLSLWFVSTVLVGYLPYMTGAGSKVLGSLGTYLKGWGFNLVSFLISSGLGYFFSNARLIASVVVLIILSVASGIVALRNLKDVAKQSSPAETIVTNSIILIGLFIVLSPTLYPWYMIWILPFLCIRPSKFWLVLSGAVVLVYLPYI